MGKSGKTSPRNAKERVVKSSKVTSPGKTKSSKVTSPGRLPKSSKSNKPETKGRRPPGRVHVDPSQVIMVGDGIKAEARVKPAGITKGSLQKNWTKRTSIIQIRELQDPLASSSSVTRMNASLLSGAPVETTGIKLLRDLQRLADKSLKRTGDLNDQSLASTHNEVSRIRSEIDDMIRTGNGSYEAVKQQLESAIENSNREATTVEMHNRRKINGNKHWAQHALKQNDAELSIRENPRTPGESVGPQEIAAMRATSKALEKYIGLLETGKYQERPDLNAIREEAIGEYETKVFAKRTQSSTKFEEFQNSVITGTKLTQNQEQVLGRRARAAINRLYALRETEIAQALEKANGDWIEIGMRTTDMIARAKAAKVLQETVNEALKASKISNAVARSSKKDPKAVHKQQDQLWGEYGKSIDKSAALAEKLRKEQDPGKRNKLEIQLKVQRVAQHNIAAKFSSLDVEKPPISKSKKEAIEGEIVRLQELSTTLTHDKARLAQVQSEIREKQNSINVKGVDMTPAPGVSVSKAHVRAKAALSRLNAIAGSTDVDVAGMIGMVETSMQVLKTQPTPFYVQFLNKAVKDSKRMERMVKDIDKARAEKSSATTKTKTVNLTAKRQATFIEKGNQVLNESDVDAKDTFFHDGLGKRGITSGSRLDKLLRTKLDPLAEHSILTLKIDKIQGLIDDVKGMSGENVMKVQNELQAMQNTLISQRKRHDEKDSFTDAQEFFQKLEADAPNKYNDPDYPKIYHSDLVLKNLMGNDKFNDFGKARDILIKKWDDFEKRVVDAKILLMAGEDRNTHEKLDGMDYTVLLEELGDLESKRSISRINFLDALENGDMSSAEETFKDFKAFAQPKLNFKDNLMQQRRTEENVRSRQHDNNTGSSVSIE